MRLVDRMKNARNMSFAFDDPEGAFENSLTMLLSQPLLYDSITGIRSDGKGGTETIFEVSQYLNLRSATYEYTPYFPGSWSPSEKFKQVRYISR